MRWNAHAVPFIEAETDCDAALLIGLVHGHLRLGQIEVFRRIATGCLSEMVGSAAIEVDRTLRLIGF
ncbi:MAG: penicillin acylase family protein, partial [Reyranella sp.]